MSISAAAIQTLDDAIKSHLMWKTRFKVAILKQEELNHEEIARDDCCDLGQWIYTEGSDLYGKLPLFTRLVDKHSDFHLEAGWIARKINAGKNDIAISALGSASRFTVYSVDVITAISELKETLQE